MSTECNDPKCVNGFLRNDEGMAGHHRRICQNPIHKLNEIEKKKIEATLGTITADEVSEQASILYGMGNLNGAIKVRQAANTIRDLEEKLKSGRAEADETLESIKKLMENDYEKWGPFTLLTEKAVERIILALDNKRPAGPGRQNDNRRKD